MGSAMFVSYGAVDYKPDPAFQLSLISFGNHARGSRLGSDSSPGARRGRLGVMRPADRCVPVAARGRAARPAPRGLQGRARGGRLRPPARLGGRGGGAQGGRQRRRRRLRHRAGAGRPAPRVLGDRRRRFALVYLAKDKKLARARLPRARAGRDHDGAYMKDGKPGARAFAARWPGGRGSGRGARAGRDGAALGQASVPPLRRAGAEAGGARLPGVVAAGARPRRARPRGLASRRRRQASPIDDSRQIFAATAAAGGRHLAPPRAGLDAGQAARRWPDAFYKGEIAKEIVDGGARGGRRDDGRGSRELRRPSTARRSRPRYRGLRVVVDAAAVVGRPRADRDAGRSWRRAIRRARPAAGETRGERRASCTCWPRRSSTASPIAPATWATPTSSRSTWRTWPAPAYHAELARRIKPGARAAARRVRHAGAAARAAARTAAPRTCRVIDAEGNAVALTTTINLRLRRAPGRGQDRHRAQRRDGRLLAAARRPQRLRADRQRAERGRAAASARCRR